MYSILAVITFLSFLRSSGGFTALGTQIGSYERTLASIVVLYVWIKCNLIFCFVFFFFFFNLFVCCCFGCLLGVRDWFDVFLFFFICSCVAVVVLGVCWVYVIDLTFSNIVVLGVFWVDVIDLTFSNIVGFVFSNLFPRVWINFSLSFRSFGIFFCVPTEFRNNSNIVLDVILRAQILYCCRNFRYWIWTCLLYYHGGKRKEKFPKLFLCDLKISQKKKKQG